MPYRRGRRRGPARRAPYRRKVHNLNTLHGYLPLNRSVPWLPEMKKTRMRWSVGTQQALITLGSYIAVGYAANDIYNPGGGSRQAYGWDQLGTLWNNWMVIGAKATIQIIPIDSSNSADVPIMWGAYINPTAVGFDYLDWRDPVEARIGTWMGPTNGSRTGLQTMVCTYSPSKLYGRALDQVSSLVGTAGITPASPTNVDYFVIWYQPQDRATGVAAGYYKMNVVIDYSVLWFNPRAVPAS